MEGVLNERESKFTKREQIWPVALNCDVIKLCISAQTVSSLQWRFNVSESRSGDVFHAVNVIHAGEKYKC